MISRPPPPVQQHGMRRKGWTGCRPGPLAPGDSIHRCMPAPPEVWFAAAIFESVVYPYHQQGDGGGGGGGSVRVEEMER